MLKTAVLISNEEDLHHFLESIGLQEENFYKNFTLTGYQMEMCGDHKYYFLYQSFTRRAVRWKKNFQNTFVQNHSVFNVSPEDNLCFFVAWLYSKERIVVGMSSLHESCLKLFVWLLTLSVTTREKIIPP